MVVSQRLMDIWQRLTLLARTKARTELEERFTHTHTHTHARARARTHARVPPGLYVTLTLTPTGMSILTHPLQYISGKNHDRRLTRL